MNIVARAILMESGINRGNIMEDVIKKDALKRYRKHSKVGRKKTKEIEEGMFSAGGQLVKDLAKKAGAVTEKVVTKPWKSNVAKVGYKYGGSGTKPYLP